ncbi:hypothetical protein TPHA_0J02960 [Tetrapisispora phaffii CBS 4417]|uniref:Phosphoribosylglycinamide formyltransferase n=1 Tax=Tetrapisispora phaffii (strain ATCC 24235 / CBS 4417 / NBRC 1672 / NRRL Y-8282 / UCD 70-5) TaxID=1071381 RepID=G8BY66_TETPH|nr:hypothetical protein TPHA_0J02960 [Tetrapisispora phaffii CBS 4417]CCE65117.1 hypothetical protein TPHA_0J02960 [Tetrapisispora phaffii CBS 4417]
MPKIVVLISGSGSNLQALIDAKNTGRLENVDISVVISSSKKAYGLTRAHNNNIPTVVHSLFQYNKDIDKKDTVNREIARRAFEKDLSIIINKHSPDLIVCAGWLLILGKTFLSNIDSIPIINLHPALPRAFDGTTHAIELAWNQCQEQNKPLEAGCMVHYVIEEVDRGEPLVVKKLQIIPGNETLEAYEARVHQEEHAAIVEATIKALKEHNKL